MPVQGGTVQPQLGTASQQAKASPKPPAIIKRRDKAVSEPPIQPGVTLVPEEEAEKDASKLSKAESGKTVPAKPGATAYTDSAAMAEKLSSLEKQTAQAKAKMPKLQPGEIYIDEEGIIHQAGDAAAKSA
jgi:hypothetical protein